MRRVSRPRCRGRSPASARDPAATQTARRGTAEARDWHRCRTPARTATRTAPVRRRESPGRLRSRVEPWRQTPAFQNSCVPGSTGAPLASRRRSLASSAGSTAGRQNVRCSRSEPTDQAREHQVQPLRRLDTVPGVWRIQPQRKCNLALGERCECAEEIRETALIAREERTDECRRLAHASAGERFPRSFGGRSAGHAHRAAADA